MNPGKGVGRELQDDTKLRLKMWALQWDAGEPMRDKLRGEVWLPMLRAAPSSPGVSVIPKGNKLRGDE